MYSPIFHAIQLSEMNPPSVHPQQFPTHMNASNTLQKASHFGAANGAGYTPHSHEFGANRFDFFLSFYLHERVRKLLDVKVRHCYSGSCLGYG